MTKKGLFFLSVLTAACAGAMNAAPDSENEAKFSGNGSTLTVTGKGDLTKVTVTDNDIKMFSAAGAGKVYTKTTTTVKGEDGTESTTTTNVAAKQGDKYDALANYYEASIAYGEAITPSTTDYDHQNQYSMTKGIKNLLKDGQTMYTASFETTWTQDKGNYIKGIKLTSATKPEDQLNSGWGTSTEGYYYYAIVTGTVELNKEYSLDNLKTNDYEIVILTTSNINEYCPLTYTITSKADNLYYSSDTGNYSLLAKDATVDYTDGMKLYLGTVTVGDVAIADNETYFKTNHSDYLETATLPFTEYLPYIIDDTYSTVVFKTAAGESQKAQINNAVTRALVKCAKINILNLEDVYLTDSITNPNGSYETNPTFYTGEKPGTWEQSVPYNTTLTTLYMPSVKKGSKLWGSGKNGDSDVIKNRLTAFHYLKGLKNLYLSDELETLGARALAENGDHYLLKTISFPNSLKYAETDCMSGQSDLTTLTFPKNMERIDSAAFQGVNVRDVYFLGLEAPKVARHAWGTESYIANNSLTLESVATGADGESLKVELSKGVATRNNYLTGNGYMTMLHYPAACTKEQAAKYTDITRVYKKIHYNVKEDQRTDDQGVTKAYYTPGKEEKEIYGTAQITSTLPAPKEFFNEYEWPNPDPSNPKFAYEWFGGDYNGAYDDIFVGSQYTWPSMSMAQRATIVAENALLWDGVTTIGEGIRKGAEADGTTSTFTGDGSEYIGLHQFVLTMNDVKTDDTKKWDMSKYADGKWHSICLPLNITKAEMKELFGPTKQGDNGEDVYDIRLCKFSKVTRIVETGKEHLTLYFNDEKFASAEDEDVVLQAHTSYMIKAKMENAVEGEEIVIKDYNLVAGSPVPTNVNVEGTEEGDTLNLYYFVGNYMQDVTMPQYSYYFSKKSAAFRFQGTEKGKWNAYTSVVEAPNGAADKEAYFKGDSEAKLATLLDEDEKTTDGIGDITIIAGGEVVSTTRQGVYTLGGQRVSDGSLSGLSKGIYIKNGKKVLVK